MPGSLAVTTAYFAALDARRAAGLSVADHPFRGEIELRNKEGAGIWTEIIVTPLVDGEGRMTELAGVTRDIRERKAYEAKLHEAQEATEAANRALQVANSELQRLATTDRLTGIRNRHYFEEVMTAEIERAARYGVPLSLLLFDIDLFKAINDTYGHLVGDQVLVDLTRRISDHLRAVDVLARWGGEEFMVLLPHTRGEDAFKLAEELRQLVAGEPFPVVGQVTSSFGVAAFRPHEARGLWLKRVDDALYAAKAGGRNRVCMAEPV